MAEWFVISSSFCKRKYGMSSPQAFSLLLLLLFCPCAVHSEDFDSRFTRYIRPYK